MFAVVFPLLVGVVVYVIVSPTAANALLAVFVAITEAVFTCVKVLLDLTVRETGGSLISTIKLY